MKIKWNLITPLVLCLLLSGCTAGFVSNPHPNTTNPNPNSSTAARVNPVSTYTDALEIASFTFGQLLDLGRNNLTPTQKDTIRPSVELIESSLITTKSILQAYILSKTEDNKIAFLSSLIDVEKKIANLTKQVKSLVEGGEA
jgi:hypothetical protein